MLIDGYQAIRGFSKGDLKSGFGNTGQIALDIFGLKGLKWLQKNGKNIFNWRDVNKMNPQLGAEVSDELRKRGVHRKDYYNNREYYNKQRDKYLNKKYANEIADYANAYKAHMAKAFNSIVIPATMVSNSLDLIPKKKYTLEINERQR